MKLTAKWEDLPVLTFGGWGTSQVSDVAAVLTSVLQQGSASVPADRAPSKLNVIGDPDHHRPHIVAIDTPDRAATIKLTATDNKWAWLAYQFGHELGHVLANSWGSNCLPLSPSHWLEEALVEAFSIYVLRKMGQSWITFPPYHHWASYAPALTGYGENRFEELEAEAEQSGFNADSAGWYSKTKQALEPLTNLQKPIWPLIPTITRMYSDDPELLGDLTFLNTWPERGTIPMGLYLDAWEANSIASPAKGRLPQRIRIQLGLT